jgi:hypothetical protein
MAISAGRVAGLVERAAGRAVFGDLDPSHESPRRRPHANGAYRRGVNSGRNGPLSAIVETPRSDVGIHVAITQEDISMSRILSGSIAVALAAILGSAYAQQIDDRRAEKIAADSKKKQGTETKTDSTGKEQVKAPETRKDVKK